MQGFAPEKWKPKTLYCTHRMQGPMYSTAIHTTAYILFPGSLNVNSAPLCVWTIAYYISTVFNIKELHGMAMQAVSFAWYAMARCTLWWNMQAWKISLRSMHVPARHPSVIGIDLCTSNLIKQMVNTCSYKGYPLAHTPPNFLSSHWNIMCYTFITVAYLMQIKG